MVERLYVHNFRCFESFTLNLAGHSSALLIGRNGTGKSTVRHCLGLFQSICRGAGRVGNLIATSDFSYHETDRPMRFEVEVRLEHRLFKYSLAFDWPANSREARILDEGLWVDGSAIFTRQHSQIQLAGGPAFGLDWHVFALPIINDRPGERAVRDIRAFFASMILIAPIPAKMTGFSEEPSTELRHDAENYASCLRALLVQKPAAYGAFDAHVRGMIPDFASIENLERGESGTQLIVQFEQKDPQRSLSIDFKMLSDGEKCFFLGAYIVAANSVGFPVFCMWDEPDNHLSLSEVGHFVLGLRKSARQAGQFIATSHHPEAIRKFSDENTFVFSRKSHMEPTVVRPLAESSYTGDLINALIRDEIIG